MPRNRRGTSSFTITISFVTALSLAMLGLALNAGATPTVDIHAVAGNFLPDATPNDGAVATSTTLDTQRELA